MTRSNSHIFKRPHGFGVLMRLMDVAVLAAAAQLASYLRFDSLLHTTDHIHTVLLCLCCALAFFMFPQSGVYTSWRGRFVSSMLGRLAASWAAVLLIGLLISFLFHYAGQVSRLWLGYWYVTGTVLLVGYRAAAYFLLRRLRSYGFNTKRVVIVGYGQTGQEIHKRARQQEHSGYQVAAIYVDGQDHEAPDLSLLTGVDRVQTLDDIHGYAMSNRIDEIWITLPVSASSQLHELQYMLRNALVDVRWVPDMLGLQMLSSSMVEFLGLPTVDLNRPVSDGLGGMCKHFLDKLFAATVLIMLSPLFLVIAAGIKYASPGPVFFKQARLGLNGKKFMVYKFRSMKVHQEHQQVTQATQHDPRITRIGQFLRRTSLDELPQFINVLIGDMSVVGPRPHAIQHNQMYEEILELYMARHRVKPGITGWAQIHGLRGETDTVDKMERRVEFDLHYIRNWSLLMDLRIVVWTAFKGWTGKNAY